MKISFRYLIVICVCLFSCIGIQGQGLGFKGNDYPIDQRTSYNVFDGKSIQFTNKLHISFDISLVKPSRLGYIVRIKNKEIGTTYNLSYYNNGAITLFKFNEEGKSSIITTEIEAKEIQSLHWFRISIDFNLKTDSLFLTINNKSVSVGNLNLQPKWAPDIYFGKSDHMIDVPAFSLKELVVSDGKQGYIFPLKEDQGEEVHTPDGKTLGTVSNPVWLINEAYYWSFKQKFRSNNVAGYNYDAIDEKMYVFNKDSLITYDLRSGDIQYEAFSHQCPVEIFLGTNFLDSEAKKLYVYEVHDEGLNKPTVAELDLHNKEWTVISHEDLPLQLHHHSSNFDPVTKRYSIFGGFGDIRYSKELYSYNYKTGRWDALPLSGDKINPRYFSSMGYRQNNNSLYIFGGMGNESGEQIVGRQYFYDLHKIDLGNNMVSKLWDINWNKENIVPVRSMVIQDDSCFYTLCYPEHFSNTHLKLYRFAFDNGKFEILGDSIPIRSDKIKTRASLHYSSNLNCLYAIVQEFDDNDISSGVKIYSLSFPPVNSDQLKAYRPGSKFEKPVTYISLSVLFIGLVCLIVWYLRYGHERRGRQVSLSEKAKPLQRAHSVDAGLAKNREKLPDRANSVYLFGEFMVRDSHNRDITYMFSAKLRQVFLTILQYSSEGGISSQKMSELLWPDRPEDKVKNSRGVTINHLRRILKELNGIELVFEKGLFKVECTNLCYCDYLSCMDIIASHDTAAKRTQLIDIISRGKFLRWVDLPEFDAFKESLEQKLEPVLLLEAEKSFNEEAYKASISLCEAVFNIDPINEEALYYTIHSLIKLMMNNEAKKQFLSFTVEYKKMMGSEYPYSFTDILERRK